MPTKPASAQITAPGAKNVLQSLESLETVTIQSLQLLRAVLDLEQNERDVKQDSKRSKIASRSVTDKSNPPKSVVRTKRQTKVNDFKIHEESTSSATPTSDAAKKRIATEAFNATLKLLTKAAKDTLAQRNQTPRNDTVLLSPPQQRSQPLQPCSPNRRGKKETPTCVPQNAHILMVAECARSALQGLRQKFATKTRDEEACKHEQGALILLDKLITLGLESLALKEAAIIHQQYNSRQSINEQQPSPDSTESDTDLSDLLVVRRVPTNRTEFEFLTTFQSQLLRLAIIQGFQAVQDKLFNAVELESVGSPSYLLVSGLNEGFINSEKAGTQLRTLSQALFKILSFSQKKNRVISSFESTLCLCVAALRIRIKSWELLKYQADLDRDLWVPMLQCLKCLWKTYPAPNNAYYALSKASIQKLQNSLQSSSFTYSASQDLKTYLCKLAELHGRAKDALECIESIDVKGTQATILNSWRIATIKLIEPGDGDLAFNALQKALDTFKADIHIDVTALQDLLIPGVRLRKVCSNVIAAVEQKLVQDSVNEALVELQTFALRLIFGFTQLLATNASAWAKSDPTVTSDKTSEPLSLITVLAKTVEATLEAEKCSCSRTGSLREECNSSLQKCSVILQQLIQQSRGKVNAPDAVKYCEELAVRLSNIYWIRSNRACPSKDSEPESVVLLKQSVEILKCLPSDQRQRGALGLKLHKLGQLYEVIGDFVASLQAYDQAIEHFIQAEALADAVKTALNSSSTVVWTDDKTIAAQLSRVLCSRLRLVDNSLISNLSDGYFYDSENLPPMYRCLLLEKQIQILPQVTNSSKIREESESSISLVYNLCAADEYKVYRLRLTSVFLKIMSKHTDLTWLKVIDKNLIEEVCDARTVQTKRFLNSFEASLSSLVRLQWAFHSGASDLGHLEAQVLSLHKELSPITDKKSLQAKVDNMDTLLSILHAVLDLSRVHEHHELSISVLKLQIHLLRQTSQSLSSLILCLLQLAQCLNRCDDTFAAGKLLAEAESLASDCNNPELLLKIAFVKVEYYLNIFSLDKCDNILEQSSLQYQEYLKSKEKVNNRARIEADSVLAHASLLSSAVAFRKGDLGMASMLARQSVKLTTSIWSRIEHSSNNDSQQSTNQTVSRLASKMSNLTVTDVASKSLRSSKGSPYWDYFEIHIRALSNIGFLSAQHGLHSDALYYYEQAYKVVSATASTRLASRLQSILGLIYSKAGEREKAFAMLTDNIATLGSENSAIDSLHFLYRAEAFLELGDIASARRYLTQVPEQKSVTNSGEQDRAEEKASKQPSKARRPGPKPRIVQGNARRPTTKPAPPTTKTVVTKTYQDLLTYQQLEAEDLRFAILSLLSLNADEQSLEQINVSSKKSSETQCTSLMQQQLSTVVVLLSGALKQLADNSVTSVLSETAIALPVKYKSSRRSGRVSFLQVGKQEPVSKSNSANTLLKQASDPVSVARELLADAHAIVCSIKKTKEPFCSSITIHLLHRLQAKIALLSSTMDAPFSYSSSELVLQSLMPKEIARTREQLTIAGENATRERSQIQSWLLKLSQRSDDAKISPGSEHINFDLIPQSWSIVSVSLTDDQQELLVSKIVRGRSPFLLRIPLSRSDELDDEDEFSFTVAREEILTIIDEANKSSHDKRGQADKEARRIWYTEREELDRRLSAWLTNVENIWLGGFRALFSSGSFDENLTARFGQLLAQTLNNHLPSRQKAVTGKVEKIELHAHVLELFLGLGSPQLQDLDDAVMDLLYFVIDILQFNGEQNAYDEIDWDAMLVETLDALTVYHSRISDNTRSKHHTVLILDKELQAFPWESLPCLRTLPTSRMPSLGSIFERLHRIRLQSNEAEGYVIPPSSKGAYILNPSSDLTSTQTTFEPILQTHMHDYASIINKPPSEDQFATLLTSHELFLYFGHGSGAQYVRGRTIRKLDKCAVSLLMGCSSAKMTECGKFESYGMPGYYSLGGSMAVVGTLWDVTDRDIDRFALSTMVEWGLVPTEDEHVKAVLARSLKKNQTSSKGKGKNAGKKGTTEAGTAAQGGKIALDEAVMRGRESCLLRFLNGAAPVIYGLPVYLG